MREILFRGKRKDNGEWVEGFYCGGNERNTLHPAIFIYLPDKQSYDYQDIDINTLGQYTGLCDKNGVRVFEGDIVRIFDGEYFSGVVKYSNEQGSFTVDDTSLHYWVSDIEVIGNIHDNSELLNK